MAKTETAGTWNKLTGTGWKKEGNKWVQYKNGRKTGQTRKHKLETNVLGSVVADSWRKVTSRNPTAKTGDNRSKLIAKNKNQSKGGGAANAATRTTKSNNKTKVTDHKDTGHTKLVKGPDGKVRRVKVSDKTKDKTLKGSDTRTIKSKDPNAKYTPKKGSAASRIQQKLRDGGHTQAGLNEKAARHAAWKKARKEGTLGDWEKKYHPNRTPEYRNKKKKTPVSKGPAPKLDKKQKTQLKTEKKVKLKINQIPKDKVKMADGSIVDRSSLYKKKKKKSYKGMPLGTRLSEMFD